MFHRAVLKVHFFNTCCSALILFLRMLYGAHYVFTHVVGGSGFQISESLQTLNDMNGETVLHNHHYDDQDYHSLESTHSQGFYDNNQAEFYAIEQKYRPPPPVRMNSGTQIFLFTLKYKPFTNKKLVLHFSS